MTDCLALAAIGLRLVSWHSVPGYNNVNPGMYVETRCGLTAGAFYNSERRLSLHAGYTYEVPKLPLFVSIAAATGYREQPITAVAMAGVRIDRGRYRLRIGYIPKIAKANDTHVVNAMVEWKF